MYIYIYINIHVYVQMCSLHAFVVRFWQTRQIILLAVSLSVSLSVSVSVSVSLSIIRSVHFPLSLLIFSIVRSSYNHSPYLLKRGPKEADTSLGTG